MTSDLEIGSQFAGCRIEGELGRGGMGVVYRAVQPRLGRQVALKVVAPRFARDESFRHRFERESRHAASIDHPHVVPIHEAGEAGGLLYLVMRCVHGLDLGAIVKRERRLDPVRAARLVAQVGSALDCAHRNGLVHRDVKPANVLVTEEHGEEHAYLTDFGLTKRASSQSGLTATGMFVGTVDFVAPEQVRGEPVDARADIYALTCVLFYCLTGDVPYPAGEDMAKMYAHVEADPPVPSQLVPGLPRQFDAVIERGMAKDRAGRYPSAGDLGRAALAAAEHGFATVPERSVAAGAAAPVAAGMSPRRSPAPTAPEAGPVPRPAPGRASDPPTRTLHRPRRRLGVVVGVLAAAVVALAVVVGLLATGVLGGGGNAGPGESSAESDGLPPESGSRDSDFDAYDGKVFTSRVPAGWEVTRDAEKETDGRTISEFSDPADPRRTVLIDAAVEPFTGTPRDSAQTIESGLAQQGSRSLGIYDLTVGGEDAAELRYEAFENGRTVRKADIFFAHGQRGFAVLGEAAPEDFAASLPLFREVADSVRPESSAPAVSVALGAKDFVNGGIGWGTEKPPVIHNGGSPSGMIKNIRWTSWGGATAEGVGETFTYETEGGYAEELIPIRLRAQNIGSCGTAGARAYLQLSVSRAPYPGGPFGPWDLWSEQSDLCEWG